MRAAGPDQVETAADRIRDELVTTLKELERRRRRATDLRYQLEQHSGLILIAGTVAAVAVPALIALGTHRANRRRRQLIQRRIRGLRRAWEHPERLAGRARQTPFGFQLARRIGVALLVGISGRLLQRAIADLLRVQPKDPNTYFS